jgi:bacterial/archaeal transporter family-2 protein
MFMISVLFSFLSGLLISVQGLLNSVGSKAIGTPAMILWLSLVQAIPPLILMLIRPQKVGWLMSLTLGLKFYLFSGIIAIVVLTILSFSISKIGAGSAFIIVVLGQVIGSALADQFGLFGSEVRPLNSLRVVSIVIIIVGVLLLLKSNPSTKSEEASPTKTIAIENRAS